MAGPSARGSAPREDRLPRAGLASMLDTVERIGNALPDPATLFLIGAVSVMALSHLAASAEWSVTKTVAREVRAPVLDAQGRELRDPVSGAALTTALLDPRTGQARRELVQEEVRATSLLSSGGLYWALHSLVDNFKNFPPLAIVLVGMLGIGVAERTGFIGALLKAFLLAVPAAALTPTVFLVGVLSSMALDAGYVVLPPVAAALYLAVGRSPLVGLAAVFAGVSAGFSANLTITALDPLLAGFTQAAAQILDVEYQVAATCNWWFMIASTVVVTLTGWGITAWLVEPRLRDKPPEEGGPAPATAADPDALRLGDTEKSGLLAALAVLALALVLVVAAVRIPGAPLHGADGPFARWVVSIVPLIFLVFLIPGLVYGFRTGSLRNDRDVARMMGETMSGMGPYIVLAFFAAQFIEYFRHSGLGEMLALAGGQLLVRAELPTPVLVVAFILVVFTGNLFIGSMSAKYAFFAPVFVPMFMQVGISPELTQAAYRIGDSVSNVITPLNPYAVIILVFMRRYVPSAGIGTLVALMIPFSVVLTVVWAGLLLAWLALGVELGPAGPLSYAPPALTGP